MTVVKIEIKRFIKDLKSWRKEESLFKIESASVGGLDILEDD